MSASRIAKEPFHSNQEEILFLKNELEAAVLEVRKKRRMARRELQTLRKAFGRYTAGPVPERMNVLVTLVNDCEEIKTECQRLLHHLGLEFELEEEGRNADQETQFRKLLSDCDDCLSEGLPAWRGTWANLHLEE